MTKNWTHTHENCRNIVRNSDGVTIAILPFGDAENKDAARIVACVNALAGVDDPQGFVERAKKDAKDSDTYKRMSDELMTERDIRVDELEAIFDALGMEEYDRTWSNLNHPPKRAIEYIEAMAQSNRELVEALEIARAYVIAVRDITPSPVEGSQAQRNIDRIDSALKRAKGE